MPIPKMAIRCFERTLSILMVDISKKLWECQVSQQKLEREIEKNWEMVSFCEKEFSFVEMKIKEGKMFFLTKAIRASFISTILLITLTRP